MSEKKPFLIYQLGTNNWQRQNEFAPGSGILHEAHHMAYNELPNVKCYSIYPSQFQTPHEDPLVEVFKLNHQIPICESAGPVSSYRWHTMSEEEFTSYRNNLTKAVVDQINAAEKTEGKEFDLFIAHHSFLNPLILRDIIAERVKAGKKKTPLACFIHGTALKMFKHEKEGKNQKEYYSRFYPMMLNEEVFSGKGNCVDICYAISNQQIDALGEVFPQFPKERTVISPNGVNLQIFHEIQGLDMKDHLKTFEQMFYEGNKFENTPTEIKTDGIEKLVVCVARLADWKRIDALLRAMKIVQEKIPKAGLVIAGGGPLEAQKEFQDLAFDQLALKNVLFLGAKPQPVLAELYTIADLGCVPSKNEPFGMVFIECMACGTPVIAADSGGPRDFVTKEVGALVPESDDEKTFATNLAGLILEALENDWKKEKSDRCKKLATEKYSVNAQCQKLLQDTREVLKL